MRVGKTEANGRSTSSDRERVSGREWASRHAREEVRNREKHGERGNERRGNRKKHDGDRESTERLIKVWMLRNDCHEKLHLHSLITRLLLNIVSCST